MNHNTDMGLTFKNVWTVECYDSDRNLRWRDVNKNRVVTTGLNAVLDIAMRGDAQVSWYVSLKDSGTVAAEDTMASHAGWAENTNYTQSQRQALFLSAAADGSSNSSGSKAIFVMNSDDIVYGAMISSDNTKGGTDGILYGAVDFTTPRTVLTGDTLEIAITLSAANG